MISSPIVIAVIAVVGIHAAWLLAGRIGSRFLRYLAATVMTISVLLLVGLLATDIDTGSEAGRLVFYIGIPYFIIYRFFKKRQQ